MNPASASKESFAFARLRPAGSPGGKSSDDERFGPGVHWIPVVSQGVIPYSTAKPRLNDESRPAPGGISFLFPCSSNVASTEVHAGTT